MFGLSGPAQGVIAIVAGILILVFPSLLIWIVGIFLIIWGVLTLLGRKK